MSLAKKLVAYHLVRLEDKDPSVRIKAIQELAELGDSEVMARLQDVFKTDPSQDVRKAAQEAGRRIFLSQQQTS
jgi:HEAT repeat protein